MRNGKKKQKLEYQNNDGDNDETVDQGVKQHDFRVRSGSGKRRRNKMGNEKAPRSELKTSEQILKQRNRKARIQSYQSYRRQQNLKKKGVIGKRKS